MHILGVLDLLVKLETKISELYESFSRNYADDAGATSLFYRISIDEIAHANLVRYEKIAVQNSKIFSEIHLEVLVRIQYFHDSLKSKDFYSSSA